MTELQWFVDYYEAGCWQIVGSDTIKIIKNDYRVRNANSLAHALYISENK